MDSFITRKIKFKVIATILVTGILGYLGYLLYDGAKNGELYADGSSSAIIQLAVILGPLALSIILGWIYHIKIWIGSLLTVLACTGINSILGENITPKHVPLFAACLIIPYILCLVVIISNGFSGVSVKRTYTSSSDSSDYSGSSNYSGSFYSSSSSSCSSVDDCGAYGHPAELGANYHPDHPPMDVSDM